MTFSILLILIGAISGSCLNKLIQYFPLMLQNQYPTSFLHCGIKIPYRYAIIESITILSCVYLGWHLPVTWQLATILIFNFALITLSIIDIEHQLLPDEITLPLLWLGLLLNLQNTFTSIEASIWGAIVGYLSLWLIAKIFKFIRHQDGIGYGDFKLLAMLGAWFGWQYLATIIFIAACLGLCITVPLLAIGRQRYASTIPFAPFLSAAGWLIMISKFHF